jgi:heme exporter protein A
MDLASAVMANASTSSLSVTNLSAVRGETRLFNDLSFEVQPGQVLFIQGRNGCGKSSLLYILAGLRLPESGMVSWAGTNIEQLGKQYHSQLCFVGHSNGVKAELTVWENIKGFQTLKPGNAEAIQATIDTLDLAGYEDNLAYQLSSGQQRRLALSRLLFSNQPVWILDEPFTSLDKDSIRLFESRVIAHSQNGGIVIITSHQALDLTGGEAIHLQLEKAA